MRCVESLSDRARLPLNPSRRTLAAATALIILATVTTGRAVTPKHSTLPRDPEEMARGESPQGKAEGGESLLNIIASPILTAVVGLLLAYLIRFRERDQAVHEKRLKLYPKLVKATEPLALFFPELTDTKPNTSNSGSALQ